MKNLWKIVKEHYELFGYILITVSLFLACFFRFFVWIVFGLVILFALLLRKETKLIGLLLFLSSFCALLNYTGMLDYFIAGLLILIIWARYLLRVLKREYKINPKTLIPIILLLIYMCLPFHESNGILLIMKLFFLGLLYVVFEERKSIDFQYIVRVFIVGIIISCVFGLFRKLSPLLAAATPYGAGERFLGLTEHPNDLAVNVAIAIGAMLILKYKNKISSLEFWIEFVLLFVFGYLSISRAYILAVVVGITVFAPFYLVQCKTKALKFLGILCAVICIICLVLFNTTQIYIERLFADAANETWRPLSKSFAEFFYSQPEEWQQAVWAGDIYFDPGRSSIYYLYLKDWSSSWQTVWFGRGIARPAIGQMPAHNLFIQELWEEGIIGYIFYAAIILGSINWQKKKPCRPYLPLLIILMPYLFLTMVESSFFDYPALLIIIGAFAFFEQLTGITKKHVGNESMSGIQKL